MKLQQKVRYGVAGLYELSKHPGEFVDTDTITRSQNIPSAFAHKILQQLARAGLVFAHRGIGYKLARPLGDISAADVIDALTIEVGSDQHIGEPTIGDRLEGRIQNALQSFSLQELVSNA